MLAIIIKIATVALSAFAAKGEAMAQASREQILLLIELFHY